MARSRAWKEPVLQYLGAAGKTVFGSAFATVALFLRACVDSHEVLVFPRSRLTAALARCRPVLSGRFVRFARLAASCFAIAQPFVSDLG